MHYFLHIIDTFLIYETQKGQQIFSAVLYSSLIQPIMSEAFYVFQKYFEHILSIVFHNFTFLIHFISASSACTIIVHSYQLKEC